MNSKDGNPAFTNCTFSKNEVLASRGGGWFNNSNATFNDCTFSENSQEHWIIGHSDGGGGMSLIMGWFTVTGCTFSKNSTSHWGGGICSIISNTTVTNCTFSENSATQGGGMFINSNDPSVTNCTFYYNQATSGHGIYNQSGITSVKNTIIVGNTEPGIYIEGGTINKFNNITTNDPNLYIGPLADNGGPTLNHAIKSICSIAVEKGTAYGAPETDQRGMARMGVPDIGAYEYQDIPLIPSVSTVPVTQ